MRTRALSKHQVDRYLGLLSSGDDTGNGAGDGASQLRFRPSLIFDDPDRAEAARHLEGIDGPILAIAPGSRHATKQWPLERYQQLAQRFRGDGLGEVILLGGPGEEETCNAVAASLDPPARVLCDVPLRVSAALLERCSYTLCNDSGLMHISEAVGTPVLALFGPTSREWGYFPLDAQSRVLEHALPCRPCSRNGAAPCRLPEQLCLTRSTVELVFSHLESQWRRIQYQNRAASI